MTTDARITHAVREVLRDGDPRTRITHAVREVLRDGDPRVRVTHVVREVLRTGFWKETTLFDGKVFIKSAVTTLFDGKAELKFAPTNFLDGKTVIIHDNDSVKSSFFLVF